MSTATGRSDRNLTDTKDRLAYIRAVDGRTEERALEAKIVDMLQSRRGNPAITLSGEIDISNVEDLRTAWGPGSKRAVL